MDQSSHNGGHVNKVKYFYKNAFMENEPWRLFSVGSLLEGVSLYCIFCKVCLRDMGILSRLSEVNPLPLLVAL